MVIKKKKVYKTDEGKKIKLTDEEYLHYPFNAKLTLVGHVKITKKSIKEEENNGS